MFLKRFLLLFCLILISAQSFSQSSATLKKRKQALNREIENLKRSRNKIDKSKKLSLQEIKLINAQISLREEKINTINSEVKLLDNQIQDNTSEVRSLQGQLGKLKYDYAKMLQFAQLNKSAYNKLMFIFAAENFNQAYMRLKYLQQVTSYRKRQAGYIQKTQSNLKVQINRLDQNKREKTSLLQDQEAEKQNLGKDKANKSDELVKLTKQEKSIQQQLSKKEKQAAALNNAIKAAIQKEILAAQRRAAEAAKVAAAKAKAANVKAPVAKPQSKGTSILASSPADAKLSSSFAGNRGRLPKPANGVIVEGFGSHKYGNVTVYNPGINIKTAPGTSVHAIFEGQVSNVVFIVNSYTVIIRHGEYFSIYSKLKSASVSKGQKVSTRQAIGVVATDGSEGTTELQFQIWKGGTPVNPSGWVGG
ncbi:peptidoglycan DD-metalloendopeptidase family protein [Flavihumibacter sp. R14]|nr:peptidoglycan DD-metalloendopeptidase family protein [Flavihumibacter soli]